MNLFPKKSNKQHSRMDQTSHEQLTCLSLLSVSTNSCRNSSSYCSTCTPAAHSIDI